MCGILAYIELLKKSTNFNQLFSDFMNIKPRGPDMTSFTIIKNLTVGFHRLAIMDPTFHANQPYIIEDGDRTIVFVCNGEIYNFKELISKYKLPIYNNSDCMVIPQLYIKMSSIEEFNKLFDNEIKGEFSFSLFEFDRLQNLKEIVVGRDQIGIRPLYYHHPTTNNENLILCSEIKGLNSFEGEIKEFPPGNILNIKLDDFGLIGSKNFYNFQWVYDIKPVIYDKESHYLANVQNAVINSVKRRLIADKPIAFLLSGGVDSSLVAAISSKLLGQQINTFCCGMEEGTDLLYARKVAEHIGSNHKEVFFTPQDGLDAIRDVIYTTETWDTTTVRASVGQYLVCKHIGTKTDARVVLVGEGPDEVCSSYLFNYYALNGKDLHDTAKEYVEKIHMFDGRRADRCISRWGLEGRIALLDPEFIKAYWEIPAEYRHPKYKNMEKWWLRKAFDGTYILPDEVLWRKKEAFSDGVSGKKKSWFEIIQEHINEQVSDEEFKENQYDAPTKEAYYYKKVFVEFFGENRLNVLPHYWQPKWSSDGKVVTTDYVDPSARTLKVYDENN